MQCCEEIGDQDFDPMRPNMFRLAGLVVGDDTDPVVKHLDITAHVV